MTADIFETIKQTLEHKDGMSQEVRDMLILSGIISLYSELNSVKNRVNRLMPIFNVLTAIGTILLTLVVGLLWKVLTGETQINFR